MFVRVVDYVASPGGGLRFTAELLRALRRATSARFEVVSHRDGCLAYSQVLGGDFVVRSVEPANTLRRRPPWTGVPGARLLNWLLSLPDFHFEVPASLLDGCDHVWLPWMQCHRVPWRLADRVTATLHDVINVEFPGLLAETPRAKEVETLRQWFASTARVVADTRATVDATARIVGGVASRAPVIHLSSVHSGSKTERPGQRAWPFAGRPFLLCPTNISPHKNLAALFQAYAAWGAHHPLVVTGYGTDALWTGTTDYHRRLRSAFQESGLVANRDVFFLGYLDFDDYDALLHRAWALVVPTLAEGYGFPVVEALYAGVAVIASDLPVLREIVGAAGGEASWFDPRDVGDMVRALADLEARHSEMLSRSRASVSALAQRSWDDVARDYAAVMGLPPCEGGEARATAR